MGSDLKEFDVKTIKQQFKRYNKAIKHELEKWISKHRCSVFTILTLTVLLISFIVHITIEIKKSRQGTIGLEMGNWVGELKYGMAFGKGKYYNAVNRLIYEGEMKFNKYDGYGIEYYINNTNPTVYYEGQWKMGMKSNGTFYSISGVKLYSGECINDSYDGKGILFDSNNKVVFKGTFKGGYKVNGEFYDENGHIVYQGDCIDSIYHGYGEYYSNNHKEYEGYYEFGVRSGHGISYYPNEQSAFVGLWEFDLMDYGLTFDVNGKLTSQGAAHPSVLYIRTEEDLLSISSVTEVIFFSGGTEFLTKEIVLSDLPLLQHVQFLENSCLYVTSLLLNNLPSLQSLYVGENSFSNHFELFWTKESPAELLIHNCSSLHTIQIDSYAFSNFKIFNLSNLPSLSLLRIGTPSESPSYNFYNASSFRLESIFRIDSSFDLPSLQTLQIGSYAFYSTVIEFSHLPSLLSIWVGTNVAVEASTLSFLQLPKLESIRSGSFSWYNVTELWVSSLPAVHTISFGDQSLQSLQTVYYSEEIAPVFFNATQSVSPDVTFVPNSFVCNKQFKPPDSDICFYPTSQTKDDVKHPTQ